MSDATSRLPVSAAARWTLVRRLAEPSGQSQVFEVRSHAGDQKGVLKLPSRVRVQADRLKREIATLREIDHPSIAPVLDFDLDDERPWLVTPLGTPLRKWWKDHAGAEAPTARFELAARIVDALLDALSQVHERGLIHRDIKPDNVIVLGEGSPALIDFGLVYVPGGTRLSEIDGRAVANRFAAPPAAYYGTVPNPRPWWDCLGLAWLWGWLLSSERDPKADRFHWKYHPLIDDPRCERVRAVLAVCSHESTAPRDAGALRSLMGQVGLDGPAKVSGPRSSGRGFKDALAANERRAATALLLQQERLERVQAALEPFAMIVERIRARLIEVAQEATSHGLPLRIPAEPNNIPVRELLAAFEDSANDSNGIFVCQAVRQDDEVFAVRLICRYKSVVENAWPFELKLEIDPGPDYPGHDVVYFGDGRAHADFVRIAVDDEYLPGKLRDLLADPGHWDPQVW